MKNSKKKSANNFCEFISEKIKLLRALYKRKTLSFSTVFRKTFLLVIFVLSISFLYWTSTEFESPLFEKAEEISTDGVSKTILITADGLITTSTFAFVAFISISPSSSGSTVVINKLSWKGQYIGRYSILLIISVLETIISLVFNTYFSVFILYSAIISSLILIIIIIKYVYYNNDSSRKSIKTLVRIMKDYSFRGKDETILRNKVTRPFLNPMKGSHNVDFMRALLADKDVYDAIKVNFPKVYGNYKEKQKFMSQLFTNLFRSNTLGKNLTMLNSEYNWNINQNERNDHVNLPISSINAPNPDDNKIESFFASKIIDIISYGSWNDQEIAYMLASMIHKHEKHGSSKMLMLVIENLKIKESRIKDIKEDATLILSNMYIKNTED